MVAAGDGRWVTAEREAQVTGLVARNVGEATRRRKFSPLQRRSTPLTPTQAPTHARWSVFRREVRRASYALRSFQSWACGAQLPAQPPLLARPLREDKSSVEATGYTLTRATHTPQDPHATAARNAQKCAIYTSDDEEPCSDTSDDDETYT